MRFLAVFLIFLAIPAQAANVSVFFAGGQSNAKAVWADSISNTLVQRGGYENPLVVHSTHPGHWLSHWYTTGPQSGYLTDFFNPQGTGILETALRSITDAGNTPIFSGFFWFQGEGDSGSQNSIDIYEERFTNMLGDISAEIGSPIPFTLAIIDADPNFPLPTGRTWEKVNNMRQTLIDLATNSLEGSYVDTRGYDRIDSWHLTSEALQAIGSKMADFQAFPTDVPLPATLPLFLTALAGLGIIARHWIGRAGKRRLLTLRGAAASWSLSRLDRTAFPPIKIRQRPSAAAALNLLALNHLGAVPVDAHAIDPCQGIGDRPEAGIQHPQFLGLVICKAGQALSAARRRTRPVAGPADRGHPFRAALTDHRKGAAVGRDRGVIRGLFRRPPS